MPSSKTLIKILTTGLYLLPLTLLIYWQKTIYPFITPKVYTFQALIEILFAVWVILILFYHHTKTKRSAEGAESQIASFGVGVYPEYRPKLTWLSALVFVFLALLVLSAALGVSPARSFWSMQERGIGVVGLIHFFILFLILQSLHRTINWRKYFTYIFILSVVAAIFALLQQFVPDIFYVSSGGRPGSFFGNPSYLASFLIFTVFLGLWLAKGTISRIGRIGLIVCSLLEAAIIFNTGTRGAIFGLLAGGILLLLFSKRRALKLYCLGGLTVFALIVFATHSASLWQSIPGLNRLTQISSSDTTVAHRLIIWRAALDATKERPILGWGFENFRTAFDSRYDPTLLRTGFSETFFDKPHNALLEILVAGGLATLLAYLGVLIALVWVLWKYVPADFRLFGLAALGAYLVQDFFVFDTFGSYFMFFVLAAFVDGFSPSLSLRSASWRRSNPVLDRHGVRQSEAGKLAPRDDTEAANEQYSHLSLRGTPRQSSKVSGFLVIVVCIVALAMLYLVFLNVKIIYANNLQYQGLNYFSQSFSGPGLAAFEKGQNIVQPYQNEFRIMFLQTLSQMTPRLEFPDKERHIETAIAGAEKAIAAEPDNYAWHLALADSRTFFQVTNPRFLVGADSEIAQAIALSPKRQQSYYVTAKLAWLQHGIPAALKEMEYAVSLDPLSGDPHFYYGLLAYQMGNEKLALAELEKAAELGRTPQTFEELKMVGGYYADAQQYKVAISYFKQATVLSPTDLDVKLKLGIVYVYSGTPALAKPLFEDIVAKTPDLSNSPNWTNLKPLFDAAGARY